MKKSMNKIVPISIGIGILIVVIILAGGSIVRENLEAEDNIVESTPSVSQEDLKTMVKEWIDNPDEDDTNQRLEIMKAYYMFQETGQKLSQDREGLTLMNQIRKMVSLNIPKAELDQLKEEIRNELGKNECSIQCLVYDPVCGSNGITYSCGVEDAACHGVDVEYTGECNDSTDTKILYIDSKLVDCVGMSPQKCMLVRDNTESDWQMFYDKIEGFDYQEGIQYKIEVKIMNVENPPADASSLRYVLTKILSP